jgi:hypothetical protein
MHSFLNEAIDFIINHVSLVKLFGRSDCRVIVSHICKWQSEYQLQFGRQHEGYINTNECICLV